MDTLKLELFSNIDLRDEFFDSLRADYIGFNDWFGRKSLGGATAFILTNSSDKIQAFLYTKIEEGAVTDVYPVLPALKRLKVGTFKIDAHNTKLGERFIKRIFDMAIVNNVEEVYLTIFPKQTSLIRLLKKYGFVQCGYKGNEIVLAKEMSKTTGDLLKDYPLIPLKGNQKYLLGIYPRYHTRLFPDSMLCNESGQKCDLVKDVSYTNSIHKIYVTYMKGVSDLQPGDLLVIYRTKDEAGSAEYRSVATSICRVEEIKLKNDFLSQNEYINYSNSYGIFDPQQLAYLFSKEGLVVIKMTYNAAFSKRVIRKDLIEKAGISRDAYAGFMKLTDDQFNIILKLGGIDERIVVY